MTDLPQTAPPPDWRSRLGLYWRLIRADRPIGIYLLLWPALWALWVAAAGIPPWWILLVLIFGTALMRSAGCAINDYADRDFDGRVERTAQRPMATGAVTPREALGVFVVLSLVAFALVLTLNAKTIAHSFVAVALAALYPFTKRYTHMPQLVLGIAFGWAVPMAFAAQTGGTPELAWLVFGVALVWAVIYDTFYAMVDREDDRRIGVKSTAILFGEVDLFVIAGLQGLMLLALVFVGYRAELSAWYFGSVVIAAGMMAWHLWLARDRQPAGCFQAFLKNHYIGMVIFIGIVLHYTFHPA